MNRMHPDEIEVDEQLVRHLLRAQCPELAGQELKAIEPHGTDNAMFRLGPDKVVRLPRTASAATNIEKENRWLPLLEPALPIPIPKPLSRGEPGERYPFSWLISNWIDGSNPTEENTIDQMQAATDLGNFVAAMQKIDASEGPDCRRGKPLTTKERETREAIPSFAATDDCRLLTEIWEDSLKAPTWSGDPIWIHADLHGGNLLAKNHRITGVIDFGMAGVGDPACDLIVAWTLLNATSREIFRSIVQPDAATWKRGRGWAFTFGLVAYPYYHVTNPALAHIARRTIDEVILDFTHE